MKKILCIFLTAILLCGCLVSACAVDFSTGGLSGSLYIPDAKAETPLLRAAINIEELMKDQDKNQDKEQDKEQDKDKKKQEEAVKKVFEYWTTSDSKATITKWNEDRETLTIPKELDGYRVTAIGKNACRDKKNLRSVVIPEGVERIDDMAFYGCEALQKVAFPESLRQIGKSAFHFCAMENVSLPDGVESIGESCFSFCKPLSSINIPSSLSVLPEHAFEYCSLTEVSIPATVSGIENKAFSMCGKLTKVVFPGTEVGIEGNPFNLCHSLSEIIVPDGHPNLEVTDGCLIDKDGDRLICYMLGLKRTSFAVPEGIKVLNDSAFAGADFEKVTLPETVTEIGESCFASCSDVTEMELPGSVKTIRKYAFSYMTKLQKITLPRRIETIEDKAFYECDNLLICTYRGSMANNYCRENDLAYRVIDSEDRNPEQEAFMDQFVKNPSIYDFTGYWEPYGVLMGTDLLPMESEKMESLPRLTITAQGAFAISGEGSYALYDEPKLKSGCLTVEKAGKNTKYFYAMKDPESLKRYLVQTIENYEREALVFRKVEESEILTVEKRNPLESKDPDLIGEVYDLTGSLALVTATEGDHLRLMVVEINGKNPTVLDAYSVTLVNGAGLEDYMSGHIGDNIKLRGRVVGWIDTDDSPMLQFIAGSYKFE